MIFAEGGNVAPAMAKDIGPPKFITAFTQSSTELSEGQSCHLEAKLTPIEDPNLKVEWFKDGKIFGDNTDPVGFTKSLPQKVIDKIVFCSPTSFTVRDWILSKHQEVAQNDKIADKKSQVRVLKQKIEFS